MEQNVLHLIDSREYVTSNCFQHQLSSKLLEHKNVKTVTLLELLNDPIDLGQYDLVLSCLKQRTLFNNAHKISNVIKDTKLTIYDQDPWEAFKDNSPFKGSYELFRKVFNIQTISVTTLWWHNFLQEKNFKSQFVNMWMLPEYCVAGKLFSERSVGPAFIGSTHGYRKKFFDQLSSMNFDITITNGYSYQEFLNRLSDVKYFVHTEDCEISIDNGKDCNMGYGLWIKDIEAACRGAFSIRNRGLDADSYVKDVPSIFLFDDPKEVPELIAALEKLDPAERQAIINTSVQNILRADRWQETVSKLLVY